MPVTLDSGVSDEAMTVLRVSDKIWRNRTASNWRQASATLSLSETFGLAASFSSGTSAGLMRDWRAEISINNISPNNEFGLESAGLFHGLEHGHHVAGRHAEGVQGRGDLFHGGQFRQGDEHGLLLS